MDDSYSVWLTEHTKDLVDGKARDIVTYKDVNIELNSDYWNDWSMSS